MGGLKRHRPGGALVNNALWAIATCMRACHVDAIVHFLLPRKMMQSSATGIAAMASLAITAICARVGHGRSWMEIVAWASFQ